MKLLALVHLLASFHADLTHGAGMPLTLYLAKPFL
jgi:hypothetical protein